MLVAAANKHSACITPAGEVYTFGANNEAQLGYVRVCLSVSCEDLQTCAPLYVHARHVGPHRALPAVGLVAVAKAIDVGET